MVKGQRMSRIVPVLAPGSVATATRSSVHYVVTEHGIADLRGKSVPEHARDLIAIAHPDFRAELSEEARRLYGYIKAARGRGGIRVALPISLGPQTLGAAVELAVLRVTLM